MKKFLIFFMVMFGMACSAMADSKWANVGYPYNSQANNVQRDPYLLVGDGFIDMIVHFDTGISTKDAAKYQDWAKFLSDIQGEIGSVLVLGSADAQRADGKPQKNIKLSQDRAQWVVNYMLPTSIASKCNFGGIENSMCTVFSMGDANDIANSSGARDANADERAARIYIVLRQYECRSDLITEIKNNIAKLETAQQKYPNSNDLNKLLGDYRAAAKICDKSGKKLTASESEEFTELLSGAMVLLESINMQYNLGITSNTTEIDQYYYNLAKIRDSLKLSVWRDDQGKFNTSRLLSDSIAGVVLGTAGGLITSHLVKKNQLKQGFEDLNCSVGGQKVAGYGDDFQIGLQ